MHVVLMIYDSAIITSSTSCSVVKMRAADPASVQSHVISESCPVCPCLKLVIICGTRAKIAETVPIMGRAERYYVESGRRERETCSGQ